MGLGVAACAACCAGPLVAALGGIGALVALGLILLGAVVLGLVPLAVVMAIIWWRRRHSQRASPPGSPVPVSLTPRR